MRHCDIENQEILGKQLTFTGIHNFYCGAKSIPSFFLSLFILCEKFCEKIDHSYIGSGPCVLAMAGLDPDQIVVQSACVVVLQQSHLHLLEQHKALQH